MIQVRVYMFKLHNWIVPSFDWLCKLRKKDFSLILCLCVCSLTHLRFFHFYDSPHRFLHQQNLQRSQGRRNKNKMEEGWRRMKKKIKFFQQSELSGTHKQWPIMPHTQQTTACLHVPVLTADSASCFFLAMSVAELFLCSSSSLGSK